MNVGTLETQEQTLAAPALERSAVRLHYIDWLRVLAVLLLFPFHTLRVFNADDPFYVKARHALDAGELRARLHLRVAHAAALPAGRRLDLLRAAQAQQRPVPERAAPAAGGPVRLRHLRAHPAADVVRGAVQLRLHRARSGTTSRAATSSSRTSRTAATTTAASASATCGSSCSCCWCRSSCCRCSRGGGASEAARFLQGFSRRLAHPAWWLLAAVLLWFGDALPDPTGLGFFYYLVFFVLGYLVVCDPEFMTAAERFRLPALALGVPLAAFWSLSGD